MVTLTAGCRASEPIDAAVCPGERVVGPADSLLAGLDQPVREQLAACELDRRAWSREATVANHVGLELAAEYRELAQHAIAGPRRALVVRVLEADRARQIAERLAEAGVTATRVDFGRRPTRAELDALLNDFVLIGEPGLTILALDGLANDDAGPCLRLADGCAPLTWLRDHLHELDDGMRAVTLGGQSSSAALRVLADAKTIAVVTSEDGLERFWTERSPGLGPLETFAERAHRVASSGAPIRLHEPIAGLALGRAEQPLPERGSVTLATALYDLALTGTMLERDEPAYFALIPRHCADCQLFADSVGALASVDGNLRFWRVAQGDALAYIDAALAGLGYRRSVPGFAERAEQVGEFVPRMAIATADGRFLPVDEIGVPQGSLWRLYATPGADQGDQDQVVAHLRGALRPDDDAIELVPILAALAGQPGARAARDPIAALFGHRDGRVRLRALDGYLAIAGVDSTSRCALLAALADPDRRVRLWARGWIGDRRLDSELLAGAIALQLERSLAVEVPGGVAARQRDLIAALGQLAQIERVATELLIAVLEAPRFAGLQGEVSRALAEVGPQASGATEILIGLIEATPEPNLNVLRALAAIGPDAACVAPRLRATAADLERPPEARKQIHDTVDAILSAP